MDQIPFTPVDSSLLADRSRLGARGDVAPVESARLLDGREASFDEWMRMLHDRYDECLATLPQERMAFEATFLNQEADGSWWMYHLQLVGEDSPGLVLDNDLDRAHHAYAVATKHKGWEELQPRLLLAPPEVREALVRAARPA